ncbi:nascent polypeptide-associated complex subunit alpha, muscle-specific form isoform X2 [Hypomesus transpacificus]|uniref:nascent polypeptide-associated complex subunit alpha, muscle-specific form isoform X2 n=1 Tax=Hypomesus transpacificus TaxID=137520 RepID=UPI001F07C121|nr:nascent polypeptide-associated complex subunit alpha, muscle-specific form isoform X2 [Hypomesus transpacificus]
MEDKEDQLDRDHTLVVVLPGGLEKTTTVHGSKPVMDLLVTLCARYHLNPSEHHVDLLSPNSNQITFKPNSPIGSLEAERIVLKPKESEEKVKKTYIPEATVRLLINYRKSHKTVVRVNPRIPLEDLLPAICQKCELDMESTILLRDSSSQEPLDLSQSLNSHDVRELFAKDTAAVSLTDVAPSPTQEDVEDTDLPKNKDKTPKKKKEKEKKGFFRLFKRRKNKSEKGASMSAQVSPGLSQRAVNTLGHHTSNTLPLDAPKKRRAPLPPLAASCSVPANLNGSLLGSGQPESPEGQAAGLSRVSSTESCLRTKRRAPPPPGGTSHHADVPEEPEASLSTAEELREREEISPAPALSHPRKHGNHPAPDTDSSVGEGEPPAPLSLSLAEILTSSLVNRPSTRPCSPAAGSSNDALPAQPHHGVGFTPAVGSPVILRATPAGGTWRGGLTTFRVVPRASFLRQRALEQESETVASCEDPPCALSAGTARPPDSPARPPDCPARPPDCPARPQDCLACSHEGLGSPNPKRPAPQSHAKLSPSTSGITSSPPHSPSSPTVLCGSDTQPGPAWESERALERNDITETREPPTLSPGSPILTRNQGDPGHDVSSTSEQEPGDGTFRKASEAPPDTGALRHTPEEDEGYCFPPPPPPMFLEMEGEGAFSSPPSPSARPSLYGAVDGRGEGGLVPETSPRPRRPCISKLLKRTGTVPSRFAQAVALAVQRSQPRPRDQGLHPETEPCAPSCAPSSAPSSTPSSNMVPEWLPCSSLNGSSCLG